MTSPERVLVVGTGLIGTSIAMSASRIGDDVRGITRRNLDRARADADGERHAHGRRRGGVHADGRPHVPGRLRPHHVHLDHDVGAGRQQLGGFGKMLDVLAGHLNRRAGH